MSSSFFKSLIRNRTIITAIANAAVTWTILIIAPLGLFAVITCTIGVFLSSLLIGNFSDRALLFLVGKGDGQNLGTNKSTVTLEANHHQDQSDSQNQRTGVAESSLIQEQIKKLLK